MTIKSRKTKWAMLVTGLLNEPLVGLIAILPYILRKDLHASALQISIFTMLKPVVALVSFYWGATLWRNRNLLRSNWMISRFLACAPFLIFPFVQNSWFFIIGAALFQCFQRGGMPAQMEILKQNVPSGAREGFFSWSSAVNCLGGVLIGVFLSFCINDHDWKVLFLLSAGFGLLALVLQARVPIDSFLVSEPPTKRNPLFTSLVTPWKDSWNLLRERPDFARFQLGFMMGGIGLMLIMPALVLYSADELAISHVDMTISRFVWMGIGFVLATAFWRKKIALQGICRLTGLVCLLFAFSALFWILASWETVWFFAAFFLYGVAQAGSHLIWHLSGPLFAGSGDSSLFSTVNILTVGLRGLIVPLTASLLCVWIGPLFVIAFGMAWCLAGSIYLFAQKEMKHVANTVI
ncbi:MAG TPA: MFS transporter [Rhabdochlamydiaceae bacterium]|jgi:MFS family permease|nr:MFS transporter [Rhabdochlamydiaceae bacterium]